MVKDLPDTHLVCADWLAERLNRPGLVVVDTRKGDGYCSAHIPGARKLALDPHLHHPGRVEDPQVFAAEMVRLGIGPDTDIIAYDDGNNLFGARLWWGCCTTMATPASARWMAAGTVGLLPGCR